MLKQSHDQQKSGRKSIKMMDGGGEKEETYKDTGERMEMLG